jgi:integrase/recombinase XerD
LEDGARDLSRFVVFLRTTPTSRSGSGQGRPPGPNRINHILAVVREFFKHAVAARAVDGEVLAALYEVADDRHLPTELRDERGGLRYRARPRHRLRADHPARPDAASQEEWEALLAAASSWRDRFLLVLLWFTGLRIGEALGLRRSDLHLMTSSRSLGCGLPGPHLHVVRRDNPNGAWAKSRRGRTVPVGPWVLAYYDRYLHERLECAAADGCDFVFVNLFHAPLGQPMTDSAVRQWLRGLSRRAGLARPIRAHMLRHSTGTEMAEAGVPIDVIQEFSAISRSSPPRGTCIRARADCVKRSIGWKRTPASGPVHSKETNGEPASTCTPRACARGGPRSPGTAVADRLATVAAARVGSRP